MAAIGGAVLLELAAPGLLTDPIAAGTRLLGNIRLLGHTGVADYVVVTDILVAPCHTRQARQPGQTTGGFVRITGVKTGASLGDCRAVCGAVLRALTARVAHAVAAGQSQVAGCRYGQHTVGRAPSSILAAREAYTVTATRQVADCSPTS